MKKLLVMLGLVISSQLWAYPTTFLEMTSEPGDYIGQGQSYYFTEDDGNFRAQQFSNPDHVQRSLRFFFDSSDRSDWWMLGFSTHELGIDLIEGSYSAVRFPFEPDGSAGLSVSGNGRGSNRLTGNFEILEVGFSLDGVLESFAATFEQHSGGREPALYGKFAYNSDAFAVDEPASILLLGLGLFGVYLRRKKAF